MKLGNTTISSIFKGNTEISKIYKGTLVVYEAFKKFVANGVPPITLVNAQQSELIDYKIYGNTIQNVDTTNIYDGTYTSGELYDVNGVLTPNSAVSMSSKYEILYNKYDYTFPAIQSAVIRVNFFDENETWIAQEVMDDTDATKTGTFEVPKNAKYLNFSVLTEYINSGHIIQPSVDAEPTWEFPIEIKHVGEKTINLVNIDTGLDNQLTKNADGTYKLEYNNEHISGDIEVNFEAGKAYTVSAEIIESTATYTSNGKDYCIALFSNKVGETPEYYNHLPAPSDSNNRVSTTFTVKNNHTAIKMYINKAYVDVGSYVIFKNLQIVEGTEPKPFEPSGYKIPIEATSTLYDFTEDQIAQYTYNEDGLIRYGFDLGILEKGQYTIDFEFNDYPTYIYLRWKDIDGNYKTQYLTTTQNDKPKVPFTFNADGLSNYYVFFASSVISSLQKAKDLWSKVRCAYLQKGASIEHTITNVFLNEPLRKIDNYIDCIDFQNKKVIRQIYNEFVTTVFTKSSLFHTYSVFLSKITYRPYMSGTQGFAVSDHFIRYSGTYSILSQNGGYLQSYRTESGVDTIAYTFNDTSIVNVEQARAKVGSGFNVSYVLQEPIEEEIVLPDILLNQGTNIIKTKTKITPNKIEIVYRGK